MPNYQPGKFARPDILRRIRPELLISWLAPAEKYLKKRGLCLPWQRGGADLDHGVVDYGKLAEVLMEPAPDMPPELVESLYLVEEMADEHGMDTILAGLRASGRVLDLGENPTPADIAVQAWIVDRALLEDLHNCQEMTRPRSFRCYCTDSDPVPPFAGPSKAQVERLEDRLNAFYGAWKRGAGARVFSYAQDGCWWFLVRHGAPCRREPALERGLPTTVFYRPQRHDVLIYEARRGELQINCCAERERRVLLRLFGGCFFGRPDFFPVMSRFTLAPLVRQGRRSLACVDVPGLERVTLTEVEFAFHGLRWKRVTQKAGDIFDLVESEDLQWPLRTEDITRARFAVHFHGAKRERYLTIMPSNRVSYSRDEDSRVLEQWMEARQFMG